MTISDAIEEYLVCKRNSLTHDTYHWYDFMLSAFEKWCQAHALTSLSAVTPAHVQTFVSERPDLSDNTKHHRAQVVKTFLMWCAQEEEEFGVRESRVRRIEMPKVTQPEVEIYSPEDIRKLLAACEKLRYPRRNKAIIWLLLDTGIRAAEVCYDNTRPEETTGLRLEHTILGRRGASSSILVMGKGRKTRTVGLGDQSRLAIQQYLTRERGHTESPYLFVAQGDKPLSVRMLQQFLGELGKEAKVPHTHAHRFRHTFAINQLMAGTSDLVLMQLLGHTSLEATKIYTRSLSQKQAQEASISVGDKIHRANRRT